MRAIYLDVENNDCKIVDVPNDLKVFYNMLNCRLVEMPERKIGDKLYTIICDEEGLLRGNPIPSAFNREYKPMLFGNLLIVNTDVENCDIKELSIDDCEHITKFIQPTIIMDKRTGKQSFHLSLSNCEY